MTNADKFKSLFGIYATELWAMPEKNFLKWLNSEVSNCSEFPNNSDTISRQDAINAFNACCVKYDISPNYDDKRTDKEKFYDWWDMHKVLSMRTINDLPSASPDLSTFSDKLWKIAYERGKAEGRKKGKWIYGEKSGQDGWYCSECGGFIPWDYDFYGLDNIDFIEDFKTCPFCDSKMVSYTGADMREGESE